MGSQITRRRLWAALGIVLVSRVFVFGAVTLVAFVMGRGLVHLTTFPFIWDADIYLNIARHGYTIAGPHPNFGFWPLWPMMERFGLAVIQSPFWTVQILTTLLTFGAVYFLYRLVRLDTSPAMSRRAILALLAWPTAFFLATGYTEALYLFLSVLTLYLARTKRWIYAGLTGALLAMTRHVGIIIVLPLVIEAVIQMRAGFLTRAKALTSLGLVIFGFLVFPLSMSIVFHRPFAPIEYQKLQFGHILSNPVSEIVAYVQLGFTNPRYTVSLILFVAVSVIMILAIRQYRRRTLRLSYLAYALALYLFPLMTTNNLIGLARYSLVIFPLMIALAIPGRRFWAIIWTMALMQAFLVVTWSVGMVLVL